MKFIRLMIFLSIMIVATIVGVAQTQLSAWPFFAEVTSTPNQGVYTFTVPLHVMGKGRDDLGDLRLFDSNNQEIPYAIRVRRDIDEKQEFPARIFNKTSSGRATSEVTVDVGENTGDHNEVEIHTTGQDFRRQVVVEGSDSGGDWRTLRNDGVIFGFRSTNGTVESNRVNYANSRYRYLRIRVIGDEITDDNAPEITDVKVMKAVREQGVFATWDVLVPSYQLLRNQGAHASSWTIDFGSRLPCSRLLLAIEDQSFYRPFQVEAVDDPQNPRLLATGNLSRRSGETEDAEVINFDQEEFVQKIRLQITDYSNHTLSIESITASAAAREMVFELKQPQSLPLRLFFGNSQIQEPHYDFEKELSTKLNSRLTPVAVGQTQTNPIYTPEPKPFTERVPWLIYLVLAASSLALGWILLSLVRTTLHREANRGMKTES